jgi:hypothetical protein
MMTSFDAFKESRAAASKGIGKEAFNELHQKKPWIDWLFFYYNCPTICTRLHTF